MRTMEEWLIGKRAILREEELHFENKTTLTHEKNKNCNAINNASYGDAGKVICGSAHKTLSAATTRDNIEQKKKNSRSTHKLE